MSGVSPISTSLSSSNPLAWNDIRIGLAVNLTGLKNDYTKTEVNRSLALKQDTLRFLGIDRDNGTCRTVADDRADRSIGGAGPLFITESIDLLNGVVII